MWYRIGTLSLTINNSKVTGTGTKWADAINGVMPGMMLLGPDWKLYEIKSVESNTALTLVSNYLGSTASGQAYAIITTYEGDITQFSARFSAILTSLQGSKSDLSTWLTGTGDCQLTKDDGTTIKVPTLSKIQADYLSRTATTDQTVAGSVILTKTATFNNGYTSSGEAVMQAKTAGANVITRYKDMDGVEKGAIFVTPATGQMTQRWAGTSFSSVYKEDGTVTFPSDVYSGNAKLATRAIALGTKDLNNVFDEGDHYQSTSANATPARNYPNYLAGVLRVLVSRASVGSEAYVTQQYYPYKASAYYFQRVYDAGISAWTEWENFRSQSYNDTRYVASQGVGKTFADLESFKAWQSSQNGLTSFRLSAAVGGFPAYNPSLIWNTSDTYAMLMPYYSSSEIKCVTGNASGKYQEFFLWNTGNTTVDSNGFIKKASPIVKLFGDGASELNEQSQGVTTERLGEGVYRISGVLGFNSDGAWGERGSGVEIPMDDNKRPLIWIDSKVLSDGDIEIRTYHRTYDTGPYSARNIEAMDSGEVDKKKQPIFVEMPDGTPIDIPEGRFIDLRVEMPVVDEPEPQYEAEPEPEQEEQGLEPESGEEPESGGDEGYTGLGEEA
ncbi:pyocin knob domain-containing protein [Serratia fonticola]|uniref:pyocin knob domain-containing protein n=1 Tax=Serratia fonticola TaxID=47917 RepID=UPI0034C60340